MARFADLYPQLIEGLRERYGEAHRHYHTWTHIEALREQFEEFDWAHERAVEIALYYHDAVYDPLSATNEADSIDVMLGDLIGNIPGRTLMRAAALILATATHDLPDDLDDTFVADCARFLDMDLAILGSEPRVFAAYDQAIRQEYSVIPDEVFLPRRRRVMSGFLTRRRLYLTDEFHRILDAQARANLRRLIARLPEE